MAEGWIGLDGLISGAAWASGFVLLIEDDASFFRYPAAPAGLIFAAAS